MRPRPAARMRDNGAVHAHHAEKVRVEQALGIGRVRKLDGTGDTEAGIVHDDIDLPLGVHDLLHGGAHLRLVRDVGADVVQPLHARLAARELIDGVPRPAQGESGGFPDTGGTPGDNGNFLVHADSLLFLEIVLVQNVRDDVHGLVDECLRMRRHERAAQEALARRAGRRQRRVDVNPALIQLLLGLERDDGVIGIDGDDGRVGVDDLHAARVQAVAHVLADVKQLPRQLRVRLQVAQRRRGDGDIRGRNTR